MKIRPAIMEDIKEITEIYNDAILHTVATFDTETRTIEQQLEWFNQHDETHPIIVAELDGSVVGWASLSKWSDRKAYDKTVEISVYVKEGNRGKGIGKELIKTIVQIGEKLGHRNILSRITTGNDSSIHLHRLVGFEDVGTMRKVGEKFGEVLDVLIMQKVF